MSDEMSLLLEAFAAEAGDQVTQAVRDLQGLRAAPTNAAKWRSVSAALGLVARSAMMMELAPVERAAHLSQTACAAMADHPGWQQAATTDRVIDLVTALDRLLRVLPMGGGSGETVLAESLAAHAAWERAIQGDAVRTVLPHVPVVVETTPTVVDDDMPDWIMAGVTLTEGMEASGDVTRPADDLPPVAVEMPVEPAVVEVVSEPPTPEVVAEPVIPEVMTQPMAAEMVTRLLVESSLVEVVPTDVPPVVGLIDRLARWRRALHRQGTMPMQPETMPATAGLSPSSVADNQLVVVDAPSSSVAEAVIGVDVVLDGQSADAVPGSELAHASGTVVTPVDHKAAAPAVVPPIDANPAGPAISSELLEIFSEEVSEHLAALDEQLARLRDQPADLATLAEARRSLHTLKGAAGMVRLMPVHLLGRVAERKVESFVEADRPAPADLLRLLETTVETLRAAAAAGFTAASLEATSALMPIWEAMPAPDADWSVMDGVVAKVIPAASAFEMGTIEIPAMPRGTDEAVSVADDWLVSRLTAPAAGGPTEAESVGVPRWPSAVPEPAGVPISEEGAAWRLARAELAALQETGGEQQSEDSRTGDEDDRQLAALFAEEVGEGLQALQTMLASLTQPGDSHVETVLALQRQAHTLKGAAAMMGRQGFATLTHRMEDVLERLAAETMPLTPAVVGLLFDTADVLAAMVRPDGDMGQEAPRALAIRYSAALGAVDAYRPVTPTPATAPIPVGTGGPSIRIELEHLNNLMGMTEELVTHRAAFQERLSGLGGLLRDFDRSIERLGRVSRVLEADYETWGVAGEHRVVTENEDFDALELDRYTEFRRLTMELLETVADVRTINRDVTTALAGMTNLVSRQGRVASAIRKGLETVGLVALTSLVPMVRRVISHAALSESKRVAVETIGLDLLVDRTIYDVATTALGHLIRNAVVHGIETPEARLAAGKDESGRLTIEAVQESHEIVLMVRDDGTGIDQDRVRRKAVALGWVTPDAPVSEDDIFGFVFRPGFSTAAEVDESAGRGVGLDAVQAAVVAVRGRITVESTPGAGTCFTLRLPLAMTVAEVLLVDSANRRFALPMYWLRGTQRIETRALRPGAAGPEILLGDEWLPVLSLAELLGQPHDLEERPAWPSLLVSAGYYRAVIVVDRLVQRQELALASLGPSFAWLRSMIGATLLGDGGVAPVLDLPALLEQGRRVVAVDTSASAVHRPRIMIVDDSLSVRRVVTLALERQGWEVIQAHHGQEALTLLATTPVDAMLVDVEMPQMDGYSLLERLRASHEHRHRPVAMLTSRGADKHRQRAFDLGANAYLVKPYEEGHLISTLQELLAGAPMVASH